MAHFSQIDQDNIVTQVIVIEQSEVDTGLWGDPSTWVKTSYNTRRGVYFTPNTSTPDPDQSKAFRKNFGCVGFVWMPDGPEGEGFAMPKPPEYPSFVFNSFTYLWETPVPFPSLPWPEGVEGYTWDEATVSWVPVYE